MSHQRRPQGSGGIGKQSRHQFSLGRQQTQGVPVLHQPTVEHDSIGSQPFLEMVQPLLKALRPSLKRQTLLLAGTAREVFFQAPRFRGVRPSAVLEVGDQRSVLMKGGAQTSADGQGEDAGGLPVACAVDGLGGGDSVGVVTMANRPP